MSGTEASVDDAQLARLVTTGDANAEKELCARLYPRVRAWARKHVREEAEVSDLAQQVLVICLETMRSGKLTDPERLTSFLFGTCKHVLMGWRSGDRRRRALYEQYGPTFADTVVTPNLVADRARLSSCLEALDARQRAIIAFTFWAERESHEIARELSMTAGGVRIARYRALKQLHECMEGSA